MQTEVPDQISLSLGQICVEAFEHRNSLEAKQIRGPENRKSFSVSLSAGLEET